MHEKSKRYEEKGLTKHDKPLDTKGDLYIGTTDAKNKYEGWGVLAFKKNGDIY